MLKTRVIPTMLYREPTLVKGIGFDSWRRVGSILQAIKVYDLREVDELIFLDISATEENRDPCYQMIDELADDCFVPLTVGGGVTNIDQIRNLLKAGADKVSINSAAIENPAFIREASDKFGAQCIVVSIDVKKSQDGIYEIYTHSGKKKSNLNLGDFIKKIEESGAGEIIITSIDLDGTMLGYDIELIKFVSDSVSIPVIASGGAGNYNDMYLALSEGHASAIAAASIFHFTEKTPLEAKKYLKGKGIPSRI